MHKIAVNSLLVIVLLIVLALPVASFGLTRVSSYDSSEVLSDQAIWENSGTILEETRESTTTPHRESDYPQTYNEYEDYGY